MRGLFVVLGAGILGYFALVGAVYVSFTAIAWRSILRRSRTGSVSADDDAFTSPLTPAITVVLPAFNEECSIMACVSSLLSLRYPEYEIVIVNDGSTDATLELLRDAYDLVSVERAMRTAIGSKAIRGKYGCARFPNLLVVDKANGGKADALNCGLRAARHPYVCAVDADTILEEDALLRVARPVIDEPELVVGSGGIVRIANGCLVEEGRVTEVRLPRSRLAGLQVIDYFRAFLVGRVGWSRLGSLLIISGAFGLFRRSVIEAVGGYSTETVGEDMELVVRIHRHMRESGVDYRIEFVPDPVCWTGAPESLGDLSCQRRRWQRGLLETFWTHRRMIGNPRFGTIGALALPSFLLLEAVGPLIESAGYLLIPIAVLLGLLSVELLIGFLVLSVLLGVLLSVSALTLEEFTFRRHRRHRDVGRMFALAVLENFGYRQLVALFRVAAVLDLFKPRTWGEMKRTEIGKPGDAGGREKISASGNSAR